MSNVSITSSRKGGGGGPDSIVVADDALRGGYRNKRMTQYLNMFPTNIFLCNLMSSLRKSTYKM